MDRKPLLTITIPHTINQLSVNHALRTEGVSRAMRLRLRENGTIRVNGSPAEWRTLLQGGDTLAVFAPVASEAFDPWDGPLDIRYEDEHLLVINKPTGLLMHPTSTERFHTVANVLAHYFSVSDQEGSSFHPVHRLDKDTSGLVIIAKNAMVQHAFTGVRQYMRKTYDALCKGYFPAPRCTVHWPIDRKPGSIIERHCATNGKDARTDIECVQRSATCSHLRLLLHTGRTYQIRVHTAHLDYPLLGDDLYGGPTDLLTEQALHAGGLQFVHPMTEKEIHVKAPLPTSWERILQHCFSTATAR